MTAPRHRSASQGASFAVHAKRKRWRSRIYVNGKNRQLGYFSSAEEAREAHADAARHLGLKLNGKCQDVLKIAAKLEGRPASVSGGNAPPKKLPQGGGDFSRGGNPPVGMPA